MRGTEGGGPGGSSGGGPGGPGGPGGSGGPGGGGDGHKFFVGGLFHGTTDVAFLSHFAQYGAIRDSKVRAEGGWGDGRAVRAHRRQALQRQAPLVRRQFI